MHSPTPSSFFPFSPFESQTLKTRTLKKQEQDVPCGPLVKNLPVHAGDTGRSLVWEDPSCRGAVRPESHNY